MQPRLDHVALAVERWQDGWPRYADDLGGRWVSGGHDPGYSPMQVRYANGMKLELLETKEQDETNFLRRFLGQHGPGPHHLTFKVDDIEAAIDETRRRGYEPINIDLSHPEWKEAFLHPKRATGVLVQLAQSAGEWHQPPPPGFPTPDGEQASLVHVAHAVASLQEGMELFAGLLGGRETTGGGDDASNWVDLEWPGGGRLRLLEPASTSSSVATWLCGRQGRIHHLAFACNQPDAIPDAVPLPGGGYEVAAADAQGARLVLTPR